MGASMYTEIRTDDRAAVSDFLERKLDGSENLRIFLRRNGTAWILSAATLSPQDADSVLPVQANGF